MSLRNGKLSVEDSIKTKNNIHIIKKTKNHQSSIYTKIINSKNKTNFNSQRNKIKLDINNIINYNKYLYQKSFSKEKKSSIENLKKLNNYNISKSKNKSKSKKSSSNTRPKSSKNENGSKSKSKSKSKNKYYNQKFNDSIEIIKNKRNKQKIRKRNKSKKSPTQKMISYSPSSMTKTPKVNKKFSKIKYNESNFTNFTCKLIDNYSMYRNKSKKNNNSYKKISNNTDFKKDRTYLNNSPKIIIRKKTIGLKHNNIKINKPCFRCTSFDTKKTGINNKTNNEKNPIFIQCEKLEEIDKLNNIDKRSIYINLNNDNLYFNKKLFLPTENNTNSNTNYNTGNNSNNNTLKIKNNIENNVMDNKDNPSKTTNKIKESSFFSQNNTNKCQKPINTIERKKLSFDVIDNNTNKIITKDILKKIVTNTNKQTNQNSLIIRFENKQLKTYFQEKNNNKNEDSINSEDNGYQLITDNEQGGNEGINSVKTNNFIINKPKEENLKYSSIKEFLDDYEEQTEISPSQISKIIIGQIDGYKDIIDEDKNININDKSKSILELLSKYSFSFIKNNRQSIENTDNLNLFEDSNDVRDIKNYVNITNSRNTGGENNMPNLTNIKNIDEDYDSEDLSISAFKNNIKSINTHSKVYLNKIMYDKGNNILKSKNNINYKYYKNSINTNNTTISSGNNNKDNNLNIKIKLNEDIHSNNENNIKNPKRNSKNKNVKNISPSSSTRYNINYFKKTKNSNSNDRKKTNINEKKGNYYKNFNKSKIIKNLETTKKLNTIKSTTNIINKNMDINIIFNTNKKNKKINMNQNMDEFIIPLNKDCLENKNNIKGKIEEDNNNATKKIKNYNIPLINLNGENETIINAYFNDNENEKEDKNLNIYNNNNILNAKNLTQCHIF